MRPLRFLFPGLLVLMTLPLDAFGHEGMWLFNNPPKKLLAEKFGFTEGDDWYKHLQLSSVRFSSGGSGSFVSADGLVMTNHHVGLETLQKLSKKGKDYVKDGFHAAKLADEEKALDLELNVLMSIEDVTDQVKGAVTAAMSAEKAFEARRGVIAKIEADSEAKTGLRSNVITLYQGGQYHLYRFKRYTDVRLVFAPEQQIAFFGGDPDNFAFPRYDLDVCFFRVYENDQPAKVEHYLRWSKDGVREGDLVFVSGHPGHTDRLNTVAELEYLRDIGYPFLLQRLNRLEVMLSVYSARGEEYERKAKDALFSVANSRKARYYGLAGLQTPAILERKKAQEKALREAVARDPKLAEAAGAWDVIAGVQKTRAQNIRRYQLLEGGSAFNSSLFGIARALVRAADERKKPNEERLSEYSDSEKRSLEIRLFSRRPIYPDFEIAKLADSLGWMCEILGMADPLVQKVLAGKAPADRAAELIHGTKLIDVDQRKSLYEGKAAPESSDDPLIQLARLVDAESRAVRKILETQVEEPKRGAYDQIAKAKFAVEGTNTYPDATFTLRLSFGTVKGYVEEGKKVEFRTTFAGLYDKIQEHGNKPPYDAPRRWLDRKDKLNLQTPFNFVCTNDSIGGNSGSPLVNRAGEVVGLLFDGNLQSLVWDFAYTDEQARTVSVSSQSIPEALRGVYDAAGLAQEIVTGKRP